MSANQRQCTHRLPDRGAIFDGGEPDRGRLVRELALVLDDERVGQALLAECLGDAAKRLLVRHGENHNDGADGYSDGFARGVGDVCGLEAPREVVTNDDVLDLRRRGGNFSGALSRTGA